MAQPVLKENEYEHTEWQRFSLFRENKDGTDRASLHWQLDYGNPRIVVNTSTNLKKEDGTFDHSKRIFATFQYGEIPKIFAAFKEAIEGPNGEHISIECKNSEFVNNVKTGNIIVQSTLYMGKDDDGMVYIYVDDGKSSKIKFYFTPNDREWNTYRSSNPEKNTKAFLSVRLAKQWCDIMHYLLVRQAERLYTVTKILTKKTYTKANNSYPDKPRQYVTPKPTQRKETDEYVEKDPIEAVDESIMMEDKSSNDIVVESDPLYDF